MKSNIVKILVVVFGVLALLALGLLLLFISRDDNLSNPKDISQVVLDQPFDASTSTDIPTVTEVRKELALRGLDGARLTVDYDINGEYFSPITLTNNSDDRYPSYIIQYSSEDNHPWYIYINNGNYFATPLAERVNENKEIIITETDYLTSYDGGPNTFTNAVPPAGEVLLKKVKVIDKATLDGLTAAELKKL
jgi:hypothetical protein